MKYIHWTLWLTNSVYIQWQSATAFCLFTHQNLAKTSHIWKLACIWALQSRLQDWFKRSKKKKEEFKMTYSRNILEKRRRKKSWKWNLRGKPRKRRRGNWKRKEFREKQKLKKMHRKQLMLIIHYRCLEEVQVKCHLIKFKNFYKVVQILWIKQITIKGVKIC